MTTTMTTTTVLGGVKKSNSPSRAIVLSKSMVAGVGLLWCATLQIAYMRGNSNNNTNPLFSLPTTITSTPPSHYSSTSVMSTTSLAYEQSFGFFDDITNDDWKFRQQQARQHKHHHGDPLRYWNNNNKDNAASMVYFYNYEPLFSCPHRYRIGGPGDGPKWTCDAHRIPRVVQRRNNTTCLVYSFGCALKYMWEDGLYDLLGPNVCEFHIFDPGHYDRPIINAQRNMHYHQWGITSSYHNDSRSKVKVLHNRGAPITMHDAKFKTFPETLQLLGHENRTIDLLKADCEYCEWFSYQDWIRYGDVRQLMIETHHVPLPETVPGVWPWPGTNMTPSQFFDDMQQANFIMFSKEPNIHPKNKGNLVEWSFIKLHPDFLHGP